MACASRTKRDGSLIEASLIISGLLLHTEREAKCLVYPRARLLKASFTGSFGLSHSMYSSIGCRIQFGSSHWPEVLCRRAAGPESMKGRLF